MFTSAHKTIPALLGLFLGSLVAMSIVSSAAYLRIESMREYEEKHRYDYWLAKAKEACGGQTVDFKVYDNRLESTCL